MSEFVGFLGTSAILLLVLVFYLSATGIGLFFLNKLVPNKKQP